MFKKLLIANRGEIACRIIASAKQLGITTVAIYSQAEADAKHIQWPMKLIACQQYIQDKAISMAKRS